MDREPKEAFEEGVDLDELAKMYEVRGLFRRLGDMFRGLKAPRGTREYKIARIELQRLFAPLAAVVVPVLFGAVLCVVTMVSGQRKPEIVVDIAPIEDPPKPLDQEDPPTPPDVEPPKDVEVEVDTPNPAPISNVTPVPSPPSTQVSVKPAQVEAVMNVKSPVTMRSLSASRTPAGIGMATGGGDKYGDPTTEAAVMKVLWWLKAHQNTEGSWGEKYKVANTAFAVLTYLAHGEYPGSPSPYKRDFGPVVQAAIDYLIGCLYERNGTPRFRGSDDNEYSFLIAAYALCEAYGMTQNPNCRDAAETCLKRIIENQSSTGGWDYKLNGNSNRDDLSFGGWAIQAMKAGKMAGLRPEGLQQAINKAISCLKRRNYSKTNGFTYTPGNDNGRPTGLAGVGTLAMQLLGRGSEPEALNALNVMRDWKPEFDANRMSARKPGTCPQYYCYYATQCKYQAGMKAGATRADELAWQQWNVAMKKLYPASIIDLPQKVKDYSGREHRQGYFENKDHDASVHGHVPRGASADGLLPLPADDPDQSGRGRDRRRGVPGDRQVQGRQGDG